MKGEPNSSVGTDMAGRAEGGAEGGERLGVFGERSRSSEERRETTLFRGMKKNDNLSMKRYGFVEEGDEWTV